MVEADIPPERQDEPPARVNYVVFIGAAVAVIAFALWAMFFPDGAASVIGRLTGWIAEWFGWFYILLATAILVFVIILALSRYGHVRLGPDDAEPDFSLFSWAAMLFAAGIGTDLMFFGVAGPVTQYLAPPTGDGETLEAARQASVWTIFHYGIIGWGMYALMGISLAYFAYRQNLRLSVRSGLYPVFGDRIYGPLGHAVDLAAIVGAIFGVATTLGIGVVMVNFGLVTLFDVAEGVTTQVVLIVIGVAVAILSAVSGVARGIRMLSELNVWLTIALAIFVLATGSTVFLLNAMVMDLGNYVTRLPQMSLETFAHTYPIEWMSGWTLFFWAWWIAWASFVGLFLARISRGRTIRQFVAGTLTIPFLYIFVWISIFGNSAVNIVRTGGEEGEEFGLIAMNQPEQGFFTLLDQFPGFLIIGSIATLVGLLFYITSADSGALVMGNLSSFLRTPADDATPSVRIFWALAIGLLTIAMLLVGGVPALQNATIIMGLPFAFVLILVMYGLFTALRVEGYRADSRRYIMPGLLSGRAGGDERGRPWTWRERLRRIASFPDYQQATQFLSEVAVPAFQEVSEELAANDIEAHVFDETDEEGTRSVGLSMDLGEDEPFLYRVVPRQVFAPVVGRRVIRSEDHYYRMEVYLREGGQGYDVMDYTQQQLINDVLDQYEQHAEFLRISGNGSQ